MSLQPLAKGQRNLTTQEFVLNTLRDALLDGTLSAGSRLVQSDLAARLNVSITPVREALRDLAAEGLVVISPNRGTLVKSLDLSEVREIYELRIVLEPLMVRRVAGSLNGHDLDRAQQLHDRMDQTEDLAEWAELNRQFHSIFSEPEDQSRLASILGQLRASAAHFVRLSLQAHPERIALSNQEHEKLIEFYRSGDVDAVIGLSVEHLKSTIEAIEDSYTHQPGPDRP